MLKVCVVEDSCTVVTTGVVLGGAFSAEGVCGGGQLYCSDYGGCVYSLVPRGQEVLITTWALPRRRSGDRIPVAARFSATVQTGSGAHPASCTMGTGFFPS